MTEQEEYLTPVLSISYGGCLRVVSIGNYKITEEDESLSGDLFRMLVLSDWSQKGRPDGQIGGVSNEGPVFVMVVSGWPP